MLDKPEGPTSHDMVGRVRRALDVRRVGHTGTLDPFASGLMLICVGAATRIAEYLTGLPKTYEATATLGVATDTLDRDGAVVAESDAWSSLTPADVAEAVNAFRGVIDQVPPQFSAKKVGGEAMHRKARRGERVELPARRVTVYEVQVTEVALPTVHFRVRCSSGTYIRALARDLGDALEVGAHLTALRRTAVGDFGVEGAVAPEDLGDAEAVRRAWVDPLAALRHVRRVNVDADAATELGHGRFVAMPDSDDEEVVAVARGEELIAMGTIRAGQLRPRKVFHG